MNHTLRNSLEIKAAFKTGFNNHAIDAAVSDRFEARRASDTEWWHSSSGLAPRGFIRALLKYPYRALKPLVRPIASRLRRYLADGLRHVVYEESQRSLSSFVEIQKSLAESLGHIHTAVSDLRTRIDLVEAYTAAAARRVAVNCDRGEVLVRTEMGYLMCSASDPARLSSLLEAGELERGTRMLIQKILRPGDVFVDVGANIGIHTLAAARALRGRGKIIAFEPYEPTKRMLEKTVFINGFTDLVTIHQAAVSNKIGNHKLFLGSTSGHHSLFVLKESTDGIQPSVDVPLVRLDDVIALHQKIDLIKINAEGAELEVMEGAAELFARSPDIMLIIEFGTSHIRRTGCQAEEWLQFFWGLGLDSRVINHHSGVIEKWSMDALLNVESVNLLFARQNSAVWSRF